MSTEDDYDDYDDSGVHDGEFDDPEKLDEDEDSDLDEDA
jgi:hypothetical protein